jgi:glutaminyl-peptide cyclotransferase
MLALMLALPFAAAQSAAPERLIPEVLAVRPHDTDAFTQGLLLFDGSLFESVGRYGQSSLREVDPRTGEVLRQVEVPDAFFAEGLARVGDRLIQLTWREGRAFVYDLETFRRVGTFIYRGEGWGLCYDGQRLYMSDGSATLTVREPRTFEALGTVTVMLGGSPVPLLNELECARGALYANVWQTNMIVEIDKASGRVTSVFDASGLLSEAEAAEADVLNGVAYDPARDTFFITGKLWPKLFEVRLPQ